MHQMQDRPTADRVRRGTKLAARGGIALEPSGPAQPQTYLARGWLGLVLLLATTAVAAAQYATGPAIIPVAWLAVGPLLASLVLSPRVTAALGGWALLLAAGLVAVEPRRPGMLVAHLSVCMLLAAFAVINSALRTVAQRRLSQVRAVARVAQSALLREVPEAVTAGRLASRYVSAAAEARVGGDLLEVVPDAARPRWLIGDTRGKGLSAVRLASVAMTSFRDACAQPGLDLPEIARVVDRSVTRLASASHLRAPPATAAGRRRRTAGAQPARLRHAAGPASRHAVINLHRAHGRPAAVLHRRPAGGTRPGRPLLPARGLSRHAARPGPSGGRGRAARPARRPRGRQT